MNHETVDTARRKNFLNEFEARAFIEAAKQGRNGERNYAMALLTYRHGLRVSEMIGMRLEALDLKSFRVHVGRSKGSLSTTQPLQPDEVRALKKWLRVREHSEFVNSPLLFLSTRGPFTRQAINYLFSEIGKKACLPVHVHPHMIRHSTGYALANKGLDSRLLQDFLGHKDLRYTALYTRTAARRFEGLWT